MLSELQKEALVIPTGEGRWSLTKDGAARVEKQTVASLNPSDSRRKEMMI
jgi:hypothetical protein